MNYETTLHYDQMLIRRSVGSYWRRVAGWRTVLAMILCLTSLSVFLLRGQRSTFPTLIALTVLACLVFLSVLYLVRYRTSMARLRALRQTQPTLIVDDEGLTCRSTQGDMTVAWSAVAHVWQFPEYWLVFFSRADFITIPLASVPAQMQAFIDERARAGGASVS